MTQRHFVGIDLAWKPLRRTGLAAVDDAGRLVASGTAISDDDIRGWIKRYADRVAVVAVDAPLVVPNQTGQRHGENAIAKAYGRYGASPHVSNRANPLFDPPRAEVLAQQSAWTVDPADHGDAEHPVCIEVYPHPALVGLFSLPQRILYKKGPDRHNGFVALLGHLETVPVLRLEESSRWVELASVVANPRPGDLDRIEDEIDAVLCAHLAWLWHHRRDALQVYGTLETGYIVAPPPPTHPAVRSPARAATGTLTTRRSSQPP